MLIRDGKSYSIFFFRSCIICLDQELYFAIFVIAIRKIRRVNSLIN